MNLLNLSIETLIRLRKAYHGNAEVQGHINAILDELYHIKY